MKGHRSAFVSVVIAKSESSKQMLMFEIHRKVKNCTDLVLPSGPPGLKKSGLRRRETTTAPPRPTLCTSPYLPRLSGISKRPGACIGPAPGSCQVRTPNIVSKSKHQTHNFSVALVKKEIHQMGRGIDIKWPSLTHDIEVHSKSSGPEGMTLGLKTTTGIDYVFPAILLETTYRFRIKHNDLQIRTVLSPRSTSLWASPGGHNPRAAYVMSCKENMFSDEICVKID